VDRAAQCPDLGGLFSGWVQRLGVVEGLAAVVPSAVSAGVGGVTAQGECALFGSRRGGFRLIGGDFIVSDARKNHREEDDDRDADDEGRCGDEGGGPPALFAVRLGDVCDQSHWRLARGGGDRDFSRDGRFELAHQRVCLLALGSDVEAGFRQLLLGLRDAHGRGAFDRVFARFVDELPPNVFCAALGHQASSSSS
jgi:hypothetical protein